MKRTHLIRLAWPIALIAAFGLGYWTSSTPRKAAEGRTITTSFEAGDRSLLNASRRSPDQPVEKAAEEAAHGAGAGLETASPLTKEQIDSISAEAFRDASELKRSLAFSKLLESLTPENALTIMEALRTYDADGDEWELFRYAWASVDPEAAMAHASSLEGRSRRNAIADTITGWASKDPHQAMAWVDALEDGEEKQRLRGNLIAGMADHDIGVATKYVVELAAQGDERADRYLDEVAREQLRQGDINAAVAWTETLPEGELRGEAMENVADRYVSEDPEAAAAWAARYAQVDYGVDMIEEVSEEWSERDPQAAVSWLQTLPEGPAQAEGMESALDEWADRDAVAASEFLVTMPDSAMKDSAVSGFVGEIVREDPQAAIAWAGTIGQDELRLQTLTRAAREWYRRDQTAALAWLELSDLPPQAQEAVVRPRDRD